MDTDGFQVRIIDNEKGKGLFATRAYKKGSIIFEEKPIVCCQFPWNAEYGYLACDNCLKPLENAEETARRLTAKPDIILPYMECCKTEKNLITECSACGTKYCSNECQNEALERYHKILCLQTRDKNEDHPLVQLNEIWKQMHYPPETATIMLLARMIAIVIQTSNQEDILQTFSQFCHRTVNDTDEIAHNLLGEKFIGQIDLLRQMLQKALNNDYTSNWFTPEGFRSLLALVGTNGQGIGTNAFAQWVGNVNVLKLPKDEKIHINKFINRLYDDMKEVVGSFLNNEGSGLYVLQSKINHSCLSNADVEFPYSNNVLVLKATRDIQPGEEICISYLEDCELRSRHSRQKALKSYYLFICSCEKCQSEAGDPDETSDDNEYM
ncbi:histone-lysine N-trimethyltransferase SMYD5 isoform X1 [Vespa velutina]|uniref:histone-lysine N-trimethyltransferase SMYD5 isoform X1 n=1 Tax=Vespa crabro TaxID=7445 RepID=UPI001F006039|nr:histone-lysine N-trimethyltransferase SMYD5 isoform X1 [Vespa crabro]XP_047356820.1 histone-lysine N-trimethyltransferase SMYD5 isoform X1 [Vespa velutina]